MACQILDFRFRSTGEEYERSLNRLPERDLRDLAVLKMECYANEEIAAKWGKAPRTIERKLQLIRQVWEQEVGD